MQAFSQSALNAAESMCHYCWTRFPGEVPPCESLDKPWFAEKVQAAIDSESHEVREEIRSVLLLMDGLAEQWGDEGVFRRCRDRLRALVNEETAVPR